MRYAFTWLALVLAVAVGVGSLNWLSYRRLSARGLAGQATVMELLPKDHGRVRYEYTVGGKVFQGRMQSWPPNPELEKVVVGQTLTICFDPERPEISVLGDPKKILNNETTSIGLASIVIPTFIVGAWMWRKWRKQHSNNAGWNGSESEASLQRAD